MEGGFASACDAAGIRNVAVTFAVFGESSYADDAEADIAVRKRELGFFAAFGNCELDGGALFGEVVLLRAR